MVISDQQIQEFIQERKYIKKKAKWSTSRRGNSRTSRLDIEGERNTQFCIIQRTSLQKHGDFSVILCTYIDKREFRLRRYNGDVGSHYNIIEHDRISGFHRHTATQRYQARHLREESFAEAWTGFNDVDSALKLLKKENNIFKESDRNQTKLTDHAI